MRYYVKRKGLWFYVAIDNLDNTIATLDYNKLSLRNILMKTTDGNIYEFDDDRVTRKSVSVIKDGNVFAELNPASNMRLFLTFHNHTQTIIFKSKNLFIDFELVDMYGAPLATIKPRVNWSKLNMKYIIDFSTNTFGAEVIKTLPLIMIYCIRYLEVRRFPF